MRTESLETTVQTVTFFEDRAEVERQATLSLPAGRTELEISGITPLIDDPSLVATATNGRVLHARVVRALRQEALVNPNEATIRKAAYKASLLAETEARHHQEHQTLAVERLATLEQQWASAISVVPRDITGWQDAWDELDTGLDAAWEASRRAAEALDAAHHATAHSRIHWEEAAILLPRLQTRLLIHIDVPADGPVVLRLRYRTPCALWRPAHRARLEGGQLLLETVALAWQITGEDWTGINARFSTARPGRSADPPLLSDDLLDVRPRPEQRVVVESREVKLATLGPARSVSEELPGVDDGGEPLVYAAPAPATLPSNGRPARVPLSATRLPCTVERCAWPELSPGVHLRATATTTAPILAGPVQVIRSSGGSDTIMGTGQLGFVGRNEPFELGFGVDDGVRIRRAVEEKSEQTPITGTQKRSQTVRIFLSNLGNEPRALTVIERVPISEIEDVTITVTDANGAHHDEKTGMLRFSVELPPGGTHELVYRWRLEASSRVVLGR